MKGKISISSSLCKGCGYCIVACPKGVIALDTKFNKNGFFPAIPVKTEKCTGCALCAEMCPEIAIEVWRGRGPRPSALPSVNTRKKKKSARVA